MAATQTCLIALVVALAVVAASVVAAGTTEQRRLQVQSLFKRLNKDPVSSIQSEDGDIMDCVPISKQPAFDHPLLKNHTIQMRPSYHPEGLSNDSNVAPHSITQIWHKNGTCPPNTIPIRRTKEEDVLRASSIKMYGKKRPRSIPSFFSVDDTNMHQYATASPPSPPEARYYGTKSSMNLWRPVIGTAKDFSLAQLWTAAGYYSGNGLNTIEARWQVFPQLYGDTYPRLLIYWTRDAYRRTGCYNLQCSCFIQTNNKIAIGGSFSRVSTYGGTQYELAILIWKDRTRGNWWLQVGKDILGYWPSTIFSYLQISATNIQWGGEVYSPYTGQTSTHMGSGHFPVEGYRKASYMRNSKVLDSSSNTLHSANIVELSNKQPNCYNVQTGTNRTNWGTYIFYGGPGKNPSCP